MALLARMTVSVWWKICYAADANQLGTTMMAYTPLQLPKSAPHSIGHQIKMAIEPQLRAVHAMLRLPIETDSGLDADCHHAVVEVLLSVISGVSVVPDKLKSRGDRGKCFQSLLETHFPWERDVENAVVDGEAARILWNYYRNPLAHTLGFNPAAQGERVVVAKGPLKEADIEALEKSTSRPYGSATLTRDGQEIRLLAKALYWGVRRTVHRVATEKAGMAISVYPVGNINVLPSITGKST